MAPEALFTYGTLMPGHLRWPMLERHATSTQVATVAGTLYDTGLGWPAAAFIGAGPGPGSTPPSHGVPGVVVRFQTGALASLLADLDQMEGVSDPPDPERDPYHRIVLSVAGEPAWAYHAAAVSPGWRTIDRWESQAER